MTVRSDPACDTGVGRQPGTEDVREQLNSISAFVDGSNIYGSSKLFTNKLRLLFRCYSVGGLSRIL